MKILIAEDESEIATLYFMLLEEKGHEVILTDNGEDCLVIYNDAFRDVTNGTDVSKHIQPFDAVILDHRIPKLKGFEVAKEIISINPHQRIIIVSAYSKDIFEEAAQNFNLPLEVLQKPFSGDMLLNLLNDTTLYERLEKRLDDIEPIKKAKLRHEQLKAIAELFDKEEDSHKHNDEAPSK